MMLTITPNSKTSEVDSAHCLFYDTRIRFRALPLPGAMMHCPECGTRLEVVSTLPFGLDWVDEPHFEPGDDDLKCGESEGDLCPQLVQAEVLIGSNGKVSVTGGLARAQGLAGASKREIAHGS